MYVKQIFSVKHRTKELLSMLIVCKIIFNKSIKTKLD